MRLVLNGEVRGLEPFAVDEQEALEFEYQAGEWGIDRPKEFLSFGAGDVLTMSQAFDGVVKTKLDVSEFGAEG